MIKALEFAISFLYTLLTSNKKTLIPFVNKYDRSPLQSPNYSSSSVFSDFQCSSPVSVNQGRALPPIPVEGTVSKNSGSVRSCNGRFPSRNPLEMKLSPTYSNRELPNIPTDQRQVS